MHWDCQCTSQLWHFTMVRSIRKVHCIGSGNCPAPRCCLVSPISPVDKGNPAEIAAKSAGTSPSPSPSTVTSLCVSFGVRRPVLCRSSRQALSALLGGRKLASQTPGCVRAGVRPQMQCQYDAIRCVHKRVVHAHSLSISIFILLHSIFRNGTFKRIPYMEIIGLRLLQAKYLLRPPTAKQHCPGWLSVSIWNNHVLLYQYSSYL